MTGRYSDKSIIEMMMRRRRKRRMGVVHKDSYPV